MGARSNLRCPKPVAQYIDSLRSRFQLDTVVLFGSRARGDSDDYSDWDLFVVGRGFPSDWRDRMTAIRKDKPVGVDVFAWTRGEVRQFIYRTFLQDIAGEGVLLYGDMAWMRELAVQYRSRRDKQR